MHYYIVAHRDSFDSAYECTRITDRRVALRLCKPGMRVLMVQETYHVNRGVEYPQQRRTEVFRREK